MSAFYTKPVTQLPGGIPFTDPRDGRKKFAGMEVSSEAEQVGRIIAWRQMNPGLYPPGEDGGKYLDIDWVRDNELRPYQKNRLGNSKAYFVDGANNNIGLIIEPARPKNVCECGSSEAEPIRCRSCASYRIKRWRCLACGKERKA